MRSKLKELGNEKHFSFIGKFVRSGIKDSYKTFKSTLLLKK